MKSIISIDQVVIVSDWLIVVANGKEHKFKVRDLSPLLAIATKEELDDYELTPSGYGIHWRRIDEDISLTALLENRPV